jgi:hypothetical protein
LRLRNDIRLVGHLFERGFEDTLAHRTAVVRCCDGVAIRLGLWAESLSMSIGTIPRARAREASYADFGVSVWSFNPKPEYS